MPRPRIDEPLWRQLNRLRQSPSEPIQAVIRRLLDEKEREPDQEACMDGADEEAGEEP